MAGQKMKAWVKAAARFWCIGILAAGTYALSSCSAKKEGGALGDKKIGYVDLMSVFNDYGKISDYDKEMESLGKAKESEREVLVEDIRKLQDELSLLSDAAKQTREKELEGRINALNEFDDTARRELGGQRNELLQEVFADVEKVVSDYADKHDYDFIFTSRSLLFQKDQFNVTGPVVRELNRRYEQQPAATS